MIPKPRLDYCTVAEPEGPGFKALSVSSFMDRTAENWGSYQVQNDKIRLRTSVGTSASNISPPVKTRCMEAQH